MVARARGWRRRAVLSAQIELFVDGIAAGAVLSFACQLKAEILVEPARHIVFRPTPVPHMAWTRTNRRIWAP
jgi:hypothetical protein